MPSRYFRGGLVLAVGNECVATGNFSFASCKNWVALSHSTLLFLDVCGQRGICCPFLASVFRLLFRWPCLCLPTSYGFRSLSGCSELHRTNGLTASFPWQKTLVLSGIQGRKICIPLSLACNCCLSASQAYQGPYPLPGTTWSHWVGTVTGSIHRKPVLSLVCRGPVSSDLCKDSLQQPAVDVNWSSWFTDRMAFQSHLPMWVNISFLPLEEVVFPYNCSVAALHRVWIRLWVSELPGRSPAV